MQGGVFPRHRQLLKHNIIILIPPHFDNPPFLMFNIHTIQTFLNSFPNIFQNYTIIFFWPNRHQINEMTADLNGPWKYIFAYFACIKIHLICFNIIFLTDEETVFDPLS